MLNALRGFNVAPPSMPGEETSAVRDRLRALGYVGGSPAAPRDRYGEADDPKRLIEIDAMLHRAGDLYQQGKFAEAAQAFQQVIARRPDTADAYRYLAFVYWQGGRPADAIQTLETALKNGITHRDVRVKLGVYLSETGNAARAIQLLDGLAGDDIEALNALGIAYGQANRSADAIRTFERVLSVDPTNGLGWQNIGTVQLRAGDRTAAEASLRRALAIDDTLAGACTTLGVVLSQTGKTPEAIEMWKRAVSLDAHRIRRALQPDGDPLRARPAGRGALVRHPLCGDCAAGFLRAGDRTGEGDAEIACLIRVFTAHADSTRMG